MKNEWLLRPCHSAFVLEAEDASLLEGRAPRDPHLNSQEVSMTTQSPTASLSAPASVPTLRSVFRRLIGSVMEARQRKASQYAADYLRDRPELRDSFRIEFERCGRIIRI